MKRVHLFEFEDLPWFPNWIREHMTLYIQSFHRTFDTPTTIVPLVQKVLAATQRQHIVDLCSGAGGPMIEVVARLRKQPGYAGLRLTLTDLYPNRSAIDHIDCQQSNSVEYCRQPIDAADVPSDLQGVRSMICSLHHMPPTVAAGILADAAAKEQPFLAFELSDNSAPIWLWWLAVPIGFLLVLILTLRMRPFHWRQLFFTYCIPIIPLCIAWDGAVSNARTYTQDDMQELLAQVPSKNYRWEIGNVQHASLPGRMTYLIGLPTKAE